MSLITDMVSEGSKISLMRVMSGLMILTACLAVGYQAIFCDGIDWYGAAAFAAVGITGKVGQKKFEAREPEAN